MVLNSGNNSYSFCYKLSSSVLHNLVGKPVVYKGLCIGFLFLKTRARKYLHVEFLLFCVTLIFMTCTLISKERSKIS